MLNNKKILFAILFLAAILRLSFLSRGDVVNDEVFYGFRGIGMMDFDEAPLQTTPPEWTDPDVPFWTKLSFHDHPPLVFLAQHFSMAVFGVNNFGMRFPSAILGIFSVWLIYLLGKRLFSEKVGLFSALIYAVTINAGYISRLGLQESYVVFFMLLAFYIFLKALEGNKYFIWLGVVLGLAFLTKYTTFILVPVFLIYLLIYRRDLFKDKNLWFGIVMAILIFSPVIFYNYKLYQLKGHFDFQISYLLKQNTPEWQVEPGKEIGGLQERISALPLRLLSSNSWLFLALFLAALCVYFKQRKKMDRYVRPVLPLAFWGFFVFIILVIGPSYRFLSMLSPFMALGVGFIFNYMFETYPKRQKLLSIGLIVFVVFEIFYFYNNLIAYYPVGPKFWLSSPIRAESYNFGYNELDKYLEKELVGKMPELTFTTKYKFLEDVKKEGLDKALANKFGSYPALIVYGGDWNGLARLWVLERRHIYEGWPILSVNDYFSYLMENGFDYFDRSGFGTRYFIWPINSTAGEVEKSLMQGEEEIIYNKRGEEVFKIYKL
ncbi:MAG: glycosyltransferase family 39 protein [bacterium]|nr:glycosyltransferase family 39 protein [bacterium]